MTDAERVAKYKSLNLIKQEEKELLAYDKAVEKGEKTEYDLSATEQKIAKKYTSTGTRKKPTIYQFKAPKRKPNETKEKLIAELTEFLTGMEGITNLKITNKSRQIAFTIGENDYELTLVQKNKKKAP